jgi:hypothetical protein
VKGIHQGKFRGPSGWGNGALGMAIGGGKRGAEPTLTGTAEAHGEDDKHGDSGYRGWRLLPLGDGRHGIPALPLYVPAWIEGVTRITIGRGYADSTPAPQAQRTDTQKTGRDKRWVGNKPHKGYQCVDYCYVELSFDLGWKGMVNLNKLFFYLRFLHDIFKIHARVTLHLGIKNRIGS